MADPNVVSTATLTLKKSEGAITTSYATMVNNPVSSGKAIKVVSLYVSNVDGTNTAQLTCSRFSQDDVGGTAYRIAYQVDVPAKSTVVVIDENSPVYLNEDSSIGALANASGDLEFVCSYQEIS